jgi:hypothetical protein
MNFRILFASSAVLCLAALASAQLADSFTPARLHPAIAYSTAPTTDPIAALNARLQKGEVSLKFEPTTGYLRSLLDVLGIPVESQLLVFSKTSFQAALINPRNPRALYFRDDAAIGWVRGGEVIEVIGQDPRQGAIFYTLSQSPDAKPEFRRNPACVSCHLSTATDDVPGMFAASVYPAPNGTSLYAPVYTTDHRSRFEQRWGGWYVTGRHGEAQHMGNAVAKDEASLDGFINPGQQNVTSLDGRVDLTGYLARTSDIVALMVIEHQMHLSNLFTRAAWEHRISSPEAKAMSISEPDRDDDRVIAATRVDARSIQALRTRPLDQVAVEIVDYMLFVDEPAFSGAIEGVSGFAERFGRQGPRDAKGRSLRDLDLRTRLLRYPCSYMIYSAAFDALPAAVRDAVYARLWAVLSGAVTDQIYTSRLSPADRQAIVDILRETKQGLPEYFQAISQ